MHTQGPPTPLLCANTRTITPRRRKDSQGNRTAPGPSFVLNHEDPLSRLIEALAQQRKSVIEDHIRPSRLLRQPPQYPHAHTASAVFQCLASSSSDFVNQFYEVQQSSRHFLIATSVAAPRGLSLLLLLIHSYAADPPKTAELLWLQALRYDVQRRIIEGAVCARRANGDLPSAQGLETGRSLLCSVPATRSSRTCRGSVVAAYC
jgi:hypothetical protein